MSAAGKKNNAVSIDRQGDTTAPRNAIELAYLCRVRRNTSNGEKLYHLAEAHSISEALEKIVREMRLQEKNSASFR
jgi:hypothetical protein